MKQIVILILIIVGVAACNLPSAISPETARTALTATGVAETEVFTHIMETAQANLATEPVPETVPDVITRDFSDSMETAAEEPTPTPDPNRKPPELPAVFTSDLLNPNDTPHTYIEDTCTYLKNRWSSGKATPGTVVMSIMYHGIVKGETTDTDNAVTATQHKQLMRDLEDQGFTAINMEQFIGFMLNNDYIPERSVLLISDDRHYEEYFSEHFKPYYDRLGWPVVNAWISFEGTTKDLWDQNAHAEQLGYVDHQSHGVVHNTNMGDECTDEFLIGELKGSIDAIQEHFGKTPHAIIWPGGGFGFRPIEIAKEYGYQVGFTTHPRGPVMYNWVPLCDIDDSARPYYKLDGNVDPLFVIPRYWDTDAAQHVDTVRQLGKAAKEEAYANRETELDFYDIVCKPLLGDLD